MAVLLFGLFFLMVFLNVPVAVALGVASVAGLIGGGFSLTLSRQVLHSLFLHQFPAPLWGNCSPAVLFREYFSGLPMCLRR